MTKKKMVVVLSIVLVLLMGTYFEMSAWAPHRVGVRNVHIDSEQIPVSFNDVSIALISDINSSAENLVKAKKHFDKMKPDVLIFTGDLFEEAADDDLSLRMHELLSAMNAPLGKFAILSPNDIESTRQLLVDAGFTILSNNSFSLYNKTSESIRVNFYDSFAPTNFPKEDQYTLGFAYDANTFDLIKDDQLDVFVGGKTLGGGINLPLIGSLIHKGQTRSSSQQGPTRVLVSHGIGTPGDDYRLFSSPEILILSLNNIPPVIEPVEPPIEEEETPPLEEEPPSEEVSDDES